jgi:hypothetical protein
MELLDVCSCLAEAKEFPKETPVDLLMGLTHLLGGTVQDSF